MPNQENAPYDDELVERMEELGKETVEEYPHTTSSQDGVTFYSASGEGNEAGVDVSVGFEGWISDFREPYVTDEGVGWIQTIYGDGHVLVHVMTTEYPQR